DGTAHAGSEYTAVSGTLTFVPGQTNKTVDVALIPNGVVEGTKSFTVSLSSPAAALVNPAQATATVRDGDPVPAVDPAALPAAGGTESGVGTTYDLDTTPQIDVADASAIEGASLTFTVSLSSASGNPVTVQYATADVTAVAGVNYTPASGGLSLAIGETQKSVS